ncbi:response regulator transcription factor [Halorhodospira neutriphila]|uniref:DNA-binding response regulator n=1 Tax=Halorhodospira neutriphila TaxID=168379 RepID=A0ABS1E7R2_9GAMM|nr:response regulator [Halorhodospira neutriphila]MBK1726869.1 DNA-binding response regulator [Halorhodospira neutriphila]
MSVERVYIVDDDPDVRQATSFLVATAGYATVALEGAEALLTAISAETAGCLVLDVRLPGMDGLQLQRELRRRGVRLPIVFITGHGDIPMAVEAISEGALDFLEKPFGAETLLRRIAEALERDRQRREQQRSAAALEARLAQLTPREHQVMEGILAGKLNKVIGYELGMSTRTVEVHRARLLDKLGARNASELVRMVLTGEGQVP